MKIEIKKKNFKRSDYDRGADVLYISFEKPEQATDSILRDDVLIRKRNGKIIGLTILNASKFKK